MKKVLNLFDYIFFRIYQFWLDQKDVAPETKGFLILSLMQFSTILDCLLLIQQFTGYDKLVSKSTLAPVLFSIAILNYFRYEHNFDSNDWTDRWCNESRQIRSRKGWLIALYLLLVLLFPAVYGFLKHNLQVI